MRRTSTLLASLAAGALLLTACGGGGGDPLAGGSGGGDDAAAGGPISIGSADFPESQLLAEIYAQAIEGAGGTVERNFNIGARETYFQGIEDGSIDLLPEYTGVLLQFVDPDATAVAPDEVYAALQEALPEPLTVLERSEAEDKDAVVVTRATADQYGTSLADYGPVCGQLAFGAAPEFQTRPDGIPGIAETYGCTFGSFVPLDAGGPITVQALADGTVQAANLFTTDPTIGERGFVVLEDPENNFAAQNVVPLINEAAATPEVTEALNAVSAALTTEGLLELNRQFNAPDRPSAEVVAQEWLEANDLVG